MMNNMIHIYSHSTSLLGQPRQVLPTEFQEGLLAYYPFNGDAQDESGNGHHGTIHGSYFIPSKFGEALVTSETTDMVRLLYRNIDLPEAWSISVWFLYPLGRSGVWRNLTHGSDYQIMIFHAGHELGTHVANTFRGCRFQMNTLAGGWHHLVAVGQENYTRFYIDGQLVGQADGQSTSEISTLGNSVGGGHAWGAMDELRIYNHALTEQEIETMSMTMK